MGYLTSITILIFTIILHIRHKKIVVPSVAFGYMWSVISLFTSLQFFGFYLVSSLTWLIILVGSLTFMAGSEFSTFFLVRKSTKTPKNKNKKIQLFLKNLFVLFLLLYLRDLYQSVILLQQGYSLGEIRLALYNMASIDGVGTSSSAFTMLFRILQNVVFTIFMAGGIYFFFCEPRKNLKYLLMVLILVLCDAFATGGRFVVVYFLVEFIVCYLIMVHKKTSKIFRKRMLFSLISIVSLSIVVLLVITIMRGASISELMEKSYKYFFGNVVFLDHNINYIHSINFYGFGNISFFGSSSIFYPMLNSIFGLNYSTNYLLSVSVVENLQKFVQISSNGIYTNAFVTPFFALYADFRWFGLVAGMFSLGFMFTVIFRKAFYNKSFFSVTLLLIVFQMIFKTLHQFPFTSSVYVVVFIAYFIVYISKKVKIS